MGTSDRVLKSADLGYAQSLSRAVGGGEGAGGTWGLSRCPHSLQPSQAALKTPQFKQHQFLLKAHSHQDAPANPG